MRALKWATGLILAVAVVVYGISFAWPAYDWDVRVPSSDGLYELVVLRGDAAAFADFSYHIYLFPKASAPPEQVRYSRVWFTPIWRGKKYLVYSGFSYPMFRWTGSRTIEIDLHEAYQEPFDIEPVKRFNRSDEAVLTSVFFGRENSANAMP